MREQGTEAQRGDQSDEATERRSDEGAQAVDPTTPSSLRRSIASSPVICCLLLVVGLVQGVVVAQPTQEEFFRSVGRSIEGNPMLEGASSVKLMAVVFSVAGLLLLLLVLGHRRERGVKPAPRALNHRRKLMAEVTRAVPLDRQMLRRLEARAQRESVSSPLVYLLCPSLLETDRPRGRPDQTRANDE